MRKYYKPLISYFIMSGITSSVIASSNIVTTFLCFPDSNSYKLLKYRSLYLYYGWCLTTKTFYYGILWPIVPFCIIINPIDVLTLSNTANSIIENKIGNKIEFKNR